MKKIYLTYKQIETLCFSKIISISEEQFNIRRSRKFYEFAIFIDNDKIVNESDNIILLFSSLTKIEIPKSEFNLFKNQFKIPLGMLELADRKVPKDLVNETDIFTIDEEVLKLYSRLRRSFTQLILFGYKHESAEIRDSISEFLSRITNLSEFESSLIIAINDKGEFPQLVLKDINPEEFYKYVWWGKFSIDTILKPQEEVSESMKLLNNEVRQGKLHLRKYLTPRKHHKPTRLET